METPYSDSSVEGRLRVGDPDAVGVVSRWISLVLTSWRFRDLRNDRLDLLQETIARILEALNQHRFDPTRDFRVYVQGIAHRTAVRALLKGSRELTGGSSFEIPDPAFGLDPAAGPRRLMAHEILLRLAEPCRSLVLRYYLEGETYEEIAVDLGVPIGTVKSRLFRCIEAAHSGERPARSVSRTTPAFRAPRPDPDR